MRISQDTIQRIMQASDVSDVISDFVTLKKRGANLMACCPFHNEKTPSFYVSPSKGIYKCFGCGKSGDSVRFIMDIEGIGYPDALRYLAKKYAIEVEERDQTDKETEAQNERESLYIVLEFAKKYYQNFMFENEIGRAIGKEYFKERGFNESTIKTFDLGYSPDNWDSFTKHALLHGYSLDILEKAGLSIIKENKDPIDRFRGRTIFPIHNISGKIIAFGARILKKDANAPKYLNSPETSVYHKSNIVYGIFLAKNAIRNEDNCFLVEGYTDVIAMYQAGIQNVVASSGTSLTKEQIQLIRRFTTNITILFDGDSAGIKASLRGVDIILEEGLNVKTVIFPDGDDPDSFVKKVGSSSFKEYIDKTSQNFITFKTSIFLKDLGNDPIKKAELISDLVQSITKIPDAIKRAVFFNEVSNLLNIDEQILIAESNKVILKRNQDRNPQKKVNNQFSNEINIPIQDSIENNIILSDEKITNKSPLFYHEEECIRLLVCYGNNIIEHNSVLNFDITLADYIFQELKDLTFETPIFEKILLLLKVKHVQKQMPDISFFTSHQDREIQQLSINWLTSPNQISQNWAKRDIVIPTELDKLPEMAYTNILRLKKTKFEVEISHLSIRLAEAENFDIQEQIIIRMMQIKGVIRKIAEELGTVVQG